MRDEGNEDAEGWCDGSDDGLKEGCEEVEGASVSLDIILLAVSIISPREYKRLPLSVSTLRNPRIGQPTAECNRVINSDEKSGYGENFMVVGAVECVFVAGTFKK